MNITDSVVIITGASSGLGLECARQLTARSARVYGLARRSKRLDEVENELGSRFTGIVCDVREEASVKEAVARVVTLEDRIDVLINNAGLGVFGPVVELSAEEWDTMMNTNLRGIFLCTQAVVPLMKRQNAASGFGGHIVNIASIAGLLGNPSLSGYNASKFAVRGFSESVMKELREDGIKVSCVYPGSIRTEFSDVAGSNIAPNAMTARDVASTVVHLLDTHENYLISEVIMRPLRPRG